MSKEQLVNNFRNKYGLSGLHYKPAEYMGYEDFTDEVESDFIKAIDQTREETIRECINKLDNFFTPATSTRGQGGLPLHGTVKDWKMEITKDGLEQLKSSLKSLINK